MSVEWRVASGEKVTHYRQLIVWQKAIALTKSVYELTHAFPREEAYGLTAQLRRAAVSVPSNIAEGQAKCTTADFIRFLSHAEGSLAEIDTQLVLAVELGFASPTVVSQAAGLVGECQRMLKAMRASLATRHSPLQDDFSPA